MTREEAQNAIAEKCGAKIHEPRRKGAGYCSFDDFIFELNVFTRGKKKIAGFYYYSDTDLHSKKNMQQPIGPWLQSLLKKAGFEISVAKEHRAPRSEASVDEGHVADFYLDFDWENPSDDNFGKIVDLYKRLKSFQEKYWPSDPDELNRKIEGYNSDNEAEIREYINERLRTGTNNPDVSADKIEQIEGKDISSMDRIKSLLENDFNVILTGAPGTGKTYAAKKVAMDISKDEWDSEKGKWEYGRIASVQFHPGYDYSDFVIGMKPVLVSEQEGREVFKNEKGELYTTDNDDPKGKPSPFSGKTSVSYAWKDGLFKKFAAKAKGDLEHNYVFLIDEINRADPSRVFGELFSLLEEEYRYPNGKGSDFILLPNGERFSIPKNLYIIGTMNDIDRSVESMDFALRRRFAWYEVKPQDPNSTELDAIIKAKQEDGKISNENAKKLDKAMKALNKLIAPPLKKENEDGTGNQGRDVSLDLRLGSEYQLGGAIFAKLEKYVKNSEGELHDADIGEFEKLWSFHIKNILSEYLRGRSNREILLGELEQKYYAAIKDEPQKKTANPNGDSVTEDPNPATDSKSQS